MTFSDALRKRTRLKSFTLIELLMVVLILGLVTGLAAPNFSKTYERLQLSETAKNIASLMRYAQGRAIMKGKECRVEFDLNRARYVLKEQVSGAQDANTQDVFQNIPGRFGRAFPIPPGVAVVAENPRVRFYPDGRMDKIRIYLKDAKENTLTVSTQEQAGTVQIYDFKVE